MKHPTQTDLGDLVRREVILCVSSLVSTLASGYGHCSQRTRDYPHEGLIEQAAELSHPLDDYEEAATEAGWTATGWEENGSKGFSLNGEDVEHYADWQTLCDQNDIEPYQREVYEHWAVSSWLAEKLIAQGEKVDTDFAGMNVWARTTTGQAILLDRVIERIWIDLHKDDTGC